MSLRIVVLALAAAIALPVQAVGAQQPDENILVVTPITEDLYQFRVGSTVSVFLVTADGIVLADPLGRDTVDRLKKEFEKRFPDRPVRYVVHVSTRFDRVEGANRVNDTAELVGHRSFNDQIRRARERLPAAVATLDRNRNGVLEKAELEGDPRGARLLDYDANGDGRVSAGELYQYVVNAESDFRTSRTIALGDATTELIYVGSAAGSPRVAVRFPRQRRLFMEDFPDLQQPFATTAKPGEVLALLRAVAALDFDTLITGDGLTVPHADIVAAQSYLDDLHAGVLAGYEAGRSVAQLQADRFLETHAHVPAYAGRQQQIAAVYANVRAARLFVDVGPVARRLNANETYCEGFTLCGRDVIVPGGKVELAVSYRRLGVAVETSLEAQTLASRTGPVYEDAWQQRVATGSLLVGRIAPPARRWAYNLLGGVSMMRSDAAGISRVRQAFFPAGSIRPRHDRVTTWGITGGADIALLTRGRMALTVPARFTYAFGELGDIFPGPLSITGGVGFRWRLYRSAD